MQLSKEVTDLMGQKVEYVRAKLGEDGQPSLLRSTGIIVGIIIGATRRIQIMVKDDSEDTSKAWTLDLMCINPTLKDAERYFEHHKKLKAVVEEHNQSQKDRETAKIKEVDDLNYAFFGQPIDA